MNPEGQVNILLVDDQLPRLMSYEAVLQELGENLVCARSGDEALGLLMQREFAVILLDVNMPGMDGFETAEMIHQHPRFENTPIIFVTGVNISEFDRLKGYKLGAVDYVLVPVVPEILRSKVMVLVQLHRQRLELQRLNSDLAQSNLQLAQANQLLQAEKAKELEQLNQILEKANAQLLQADRRKNEFLAMLGHELRNPLASISNALEIVRVHQQEQPVPELKWPREILSRQVAKLTRLVDDLLDISRITRDQIELRCAALDLRQAVQNAIDSNTPILQARRQQLLADLPEQPIFTHADAVRICQVISNLINNAAKYSPEEQTIRVALSADDGHAICQVIDQGYGIPAEMLENIFDPFVQVRETREQSAGGLGMGLAIVRKLVDLHGGSIQARSNATQQGSTFEVRLPLHAQSTITEAAPVSAAPVHAAMCSILIADDDVDAVNSMSMMLRLHGHTVWLAHNGKEAVEMAQQHLPQVVLLDIGMPVMDGYQAGQVIRESRWGAAMTLIAVTGWGQQEDRQRSSSIGFDLHLVKPVSASQLLEILAKRVTAAGDPAESATG